jgi:hypothetical protein
MKCFLLIALTVCSYNAFTKEAKKIAPAKKEIAKAATPAVPCDTKEDLLKKLEEKKKLEAEKNKGFSLQGGNTGCSVK